jgi:ATP-binding cassette subfamily B protein
VKALGLSSQEVGRLNSVTEKILKLELKKLRYLRTLDFIQGTLTNLIRAGLYLFLFYLVFTQTISFGQYLSLNIYSFWLFFPLAQISTFISTYRQAEASLENYTKVMSTPREPLPDTPVHMTDIQELSFQDVTFAYRSAKGKAVDGVSFEINKGKTVAFVGPSGSGKTSVVKLLVGLYQPTTGQVLYNGVSSNDIDISDVRKQIGFVTQDTQLFAGTIRENLLFVNPNATDEECLDALKKSACQSLLDRADKGLDTVIGEGGVKISGGEKQRLSIARALLRKPTILVFDEATSSLDSLTEEEITKTVRDVTDSKNHITILVAHRLSTIMHADTIYVLEKGKIVESGAHEKLLSEKGLYYAMWRQQIGERG